LSEKYKLVIHPLESHPLAERLGLQAEQFTSIGAWIIVDFILEEGVEY